MTTDEIYDNLQVHMPGNYYSRIDLSAWLVEGGYKTHSLGELRLGWLLKAQAMSGKGLPNFFTPSPIAHPTTGSILSKG